MQSAQLYPRINATKGYTDPVAVFESSQQNVRNFKDEDDLAQKCINFVHGKQFAEDVEGQRTNDGLPSVVADKTLGVFKTLDGYARKSRINVDFTPLGNDDYEGAKMRTTIFSSQRTASSLQARQSEAYGTAAITGQAFLFLYPTQNIRGELEPCAYIPMSFEAYPDSNSKDPIYMKDARFFDLRMFMHQDEILEEMGDFLRPEDAELIANWTAEGTNNAKATRNQATDRTGDSNIQRNGLPLVIKRFYRVSQKAVKYLIDDESGEEKRMGPEERESDPYLDALHKDPKMVQALGLRTEQQDEEWIWTCILIPAVDKDRFFFNARSDFQPVDVRTRKKLWPVVRLPHLYIAGKSIGAIQNIIKLQEYRNLIISAFVHHIQTAANGALGYEEGAITDPDELEKFTKKRNRANISIKFANPGADARDAKDKVFVLPKGDFAFRDGGQIIEDIFKELVQDLTGATGVIRGEAQQGSPASLYKQQTEQADNNMMGTIELYKEFQYACADLYNNFTQQFYTEERMLEIEGPGGTPQQMVLNQQTVLGIKNDVTQGLYAVRKAESAPTESARRQRLGDNLEIVKALVDTQLPNFLIDYESLIENMEIPEARKQYYLSALQQWRATQGIQSQAVAQGEAAQAQAAGSTAQAQSAVNQALMQPGGGPGGSATAPNAPSPQGAPQAAAPQAAPALAGAY